MQGGKIIEQKSGNSVDDWVKMATWQMIEGDSPLVATAIHDGHNLREELADLIALEEQERLREEDPFTGVWTAVAETRLIAQRSRFEMDLNRPREKAVYLTPEDCWGLRVGKKDFRRKLSSVHWRSMMLFILNCGVCFQS